MRKLTIGLILLACGASLEARVIGIVVEKRESPAYGGQVFGKAGPYEILSGHFTGELNPNDPHNRIINDIQLAVRNVRGMVEYTGTFAIAKPIDSTKAERVAANDPRPSLEERYGTHDKYVAFVKAAAAKAVVDRFLFQEDADKLVAQAAASDVLVAK